MISTIRSKMHVGDPWSKIAEIQRIVERGAIDLRLRFAQVQVPVTGGITALNSMGFANTAQTGVATNFVDATGAYYNQATGAVIGNSAGIQAAQATSPWCQPRHDPSSVFVVKTAADISSQRIWVGMFNAAPTNTDSPPNQSAAFRYVQGTDTNWQAISRGTSDTTTDTGVVVAADTRYEFAVNLTSTAANFLINNTVVATHVIGSAPALLATSGLFLSAIIFTTVAAARSIRWSHVAGTSR